MDNIYYFFLMHKATTPLPLTNLGNDLQSISKFICVRISVLTSSVESLLHTHSWMLFKIYFNFSFLRNITVKSANLALEKFISSEWSWQAGLSILGGWGSRPPDFGLGLWGSWTGFGKHYSVFCTESMLENV